MVTFSLQISENALASVYINGVQIQDLELPMQVCPGKYDIDGSSCCQNKYTHSRMMNGSVPHRIKIAYVQRQPGFNGPCLKMTRFSRSMSLGSIEKDAIAIQELSEGAYIMDLVATTDMIGAQNSSFTYYPRINSNNLLQLTQSQIQACVPNYFQVTIRDIFGNVFVELPNLSAKLTLTIGNSVVQNQTVFNTTDSSRRAQIYYCGPVGQATLTVTLLGNQIAGSPMQLTVIPGPYILNISDFVEFNGQTNGCQISLPCYAKLDLRDQALNLVQLPPLFSQKDADFQFQDIATNFAEMFQTFQVQNVAPYSIFIKYYARQPGLHNLFVRFNGQKVKVYPISINVYSTVANSQQSYITDTKILTPRVVTLPLNFQVQLCDVLGNNLTSSTFTITAQLQSTSDNTIVIPQLSAGKVNTSLYNISVVAFVAQNYKLSINVTNIQTGAVTPLSGIGLNITQNWQSHLANPVTSTATGSAFQIVYTITPASLALQLRDSQRNLFNATFHKQIYKLPLFNISLVADNSTNIPITAQYATPDTGYYTFSFNVSYLFSQLNLTILLNVQEVYQHIQGSPFILKVVQRDPSLLCNITDLQASGFGLTSASKLVQQPAVITAGQNYTVKLQGINLYGTIYMPTFDPVQRLYTIDQVISACTCSPNSIYCHHFSGNYTQCTMNKQCKWIELNQDALGGTLNSCQPCNSTCNNQSYNLVLNETRDTVFTYFTLQTQLQGLLLTQANVFTQGQLRMLLYKNWDFSDFHSSVSVFNLNTQMFNSSLSHFFATKRQMWSASILGVMRFNKTQEGCYQLIQNRQEITNGSLTLATWTLTNELRATVLINGLVVLEKTEKQNSAQFSRYCADNELMEIEIRIQVNRSVPQIENGFIRFEQETFQSPRAPVLPINLFQIVPLTTSLQTQLQVLPSSVSAQTSQVSIQNCQSGRIPFSTGVRITARDQFGNHRNLSQTDSLTINVFKNNQTYSNISVTQQDPITYQYIQSVSLAEAFSNYSIQVSLNSVPLALSPACSFNLKNTAMSAPNSSLSLIQLNTYAGFNKCVFANKISFVTITMFDAFGYLVPLNDTDVYFGQFTLQFSGGSQFFELECTNHSSPNTIKCPIMPLKSGIQSISGVMTQTQQAFNPIQAITVLPSAHAPIDLSNPSQFFVQTTNSTTTLQIFTVDAYGQPIQSLSFAPCDYFAHERLIYWIGPQGTDQLNLASVSTVMVSTGILQISINQNTTKPITQVLFVLYDGLLVQDGILFEYFSNNNLQETPFTKLIQNQTNVPPNAFVSSYDMYSTRVTCYVKAPISQIYYFTGQIGNVLIVNNQVVIADGQLNGNVYLSSQLWTSIEIQQRQKGALNMQVWGNGVINGFINSSKWQAIVPNAQAQLINDLVTF